MRESADNANLNDIRILIIDDDGVNSMMAKSVLERQGCLVQVAANPLRALERFSHERDAYDLVIVDYFMPGLDGGATCQHLRKLNPAIKILLFSGADEMRLRQLARQYPVDGYIHKPIRAQEAVQAIRQLVPAKSSDTASVPSSPLTE